MSDPLSSYSRAVTMASGDEARHNRGQDSLMASTSPGSIREFGGERG